jgi:hypothetical protein
MSWRGKSPAPERAVGSRRGPDIEALSPLTWGSRSRHGTGFAALERAGRPGALLVGAAFLISLVGTVALTPSVADASVAAGSAVITMPGQPTPLDRGNGATLYGVGLPSGASCPGDSAHQGYHVFSYLVPEGVSPSTLSFTKGVADRYFGYIAQGAEFDAFNTAEGTGQVVGLPTAFTWDRLTRGDLFALGESSAVWEGGIACADAHGSITNYWNTGIRFTADPSASGGFTWKALDPPGAPVFTLARVGMVLIVLAIAFTVVAAILARQRRRQDPSAEALPTAPLVEAGSPR